MIEIDAILSVVNNNIQSYYETLFATHVHRLFLKLFFILKQSFHKIPDILKNVTRMTALLCGQIMCGITKKREIDLCGVDKVTLHYNFTCMIIE